MSKKNSNPLFQTEVFEEPSLAEECQKHGIDYNKPYFEPVMMIVGENDAAIPYFFLGTDIQKSDKLKNGLNEYCKAFWYYRDNADSINPFKEMAAVMKYIRAVKKLLKVVSAENIRLYSRYEMNEFLKEYDNKKKQELEKAKAIVEVAKKEMEFTK